MCPDVTLPALVKELVVFCYKLLGLAIMRYFKEIYTWKFAKTLNLFICRQFYFCGYYKGRSRPSGVLPSLMTSPLGMALTQFKRQLKHHYTKTFLFFNISSVHLSPCSSLCHQVLHGTGTRFLSFFLKNSVAGSSSGKPSCSLRIKWGINFSKAFGLTCLVSWLSYNIMCQVWLSLHTLWGSFDLPVDVCKSSMSRGSLVKNLPIS